MIRKYWQWIGTLFMGLLIYKFIIRSDLIGLINNNLPPVEAVYLKGILLGDKTGFNSQTYGYLVNSGLLHLMVASGSNVLLIGNILIEGLAWILGRKNTIVLVLVTVWMYAIKLEMAISLVRAALFLSLFYWSQILGRKFNVIRALTFGLIIMLVANWKVVLDVGFWLSITAFLGLITSAQVWSGEIGKVIGKTVWIGLWTTPILAMVFGKVNLISPVVNILVVWMMEFIGLLGLVILATLPKLLIVLIPVLRYLDMVVLVMGRMPQQTLNFNILMSIGWYLILIWVILQHHKELGELK